MAPFDADLWSAGYRWRSRFQSKAQAMLEGLTLTGDPNFAADGGMELDGATQYATAPMEPLFRLDRFFIVIRFTPDFDWDEDVDRRLFENLAARSLGQLETINPRPVRLLPLDHRQAAVSVRMSFDAGGRLVRIGG